MVKAASTTQAVIAFSSRESDFYAFVRGTATASGMQSMARDCGHEFKVALETDSVSGVWHVATNGCREGATPPHPLVVGAWSFPQATISRTSDERDLVTKFLDGKKIQEIV